MVDQKKASSETPDAGFSEAERMAKIRELLVGPAIADQSALLDQAFERLNEQVREQQETIATLRSRIDELENLQRFETNEVQVRLLGVAEALLANEEELRARVTKNKSLSPRLDDVIHSSSD